jgi:hypothetical protein
MNCEEFKDVLVVRIYGELPADREEAFQRHAGECRDCAQVFARTQEIHGTMDIGDDIPEPDWEALWRVIRERSRKKRWRLPALMEWPRRRFAVVAAAVAAVFIIGVLVGRSIFPPEPETATTAPGYRGVASVAAYTETLEPVLIDFMNRGGQPVDDEVAELTRRVVTDMLAQTRLLKRAVARSGDQQLYFLFEDIELVLISIANLGGQNGDVAAQLDQIIKDKSIMYRLKQLPKGNETI